jgi:glutamate synthase (NADPH/NADH) large chain
MSSEEMTTPEFRPAPLPPVPDGLYDPAFERDACGVGFVAHARGAKSHGIVAQAVLLLKNLQHRGACGCDQDTGDGAGILLQMPDAFFREESQRFGIALPPAGAYGVAFCFLPLEPDDRAECRRAVERFVTDQRQRVLGWRSVPVVSTAIGWLARSREPVMEQLFIGRGDKTPDQAAFERALYVIRRRAEVWATKGGRTAAGADFYIASCSSRTVVYKGMLKADQLGPYFPDLSNPKVESAIALVHSRYSTNTFPRWALAQPFHMLAHNGEINTLRGNTTWLLARQHQMRSPGLGDDLMKTLPMDFEGLSDSAVLDRALELLVHSGRTLPQALMMLVPEAYETQKDIDPAVRGFFEYHRCLTEPWDGPAGLAFSDGTLVGAALDRNGLRPGRYVVTHDDLVVCGSEAGAIPIEPARVKAMGRLQPGKFFLIDTAAGRIYTDAEVKAEVAGRKPYADWVKANLVTLADAPAAPTPEHNLATLRHRQQAFGYSVEDLTRVLLPIAQDGQEPVSSMGTDIPLAVLSDRPQVLFNYFKQLFAQVTNPPIDPIREEIVMSLASFIGPRPNLMGVADNEDGLTPRLEVTQPVLTNEDVLRLRDIERLTGGKYRSLVLDITYPAADGAAACEGAIKRLQEAAEKSVADGFNIVILSDRAASRERVAIPALLATSAVHHHLVRKGLRTLTGLVIDTGSARETHHFALLAGYGAEAICPWLAFDTIAEISNELPSGLSTKDASKRFIKAVGKGLNKVMSKMGISTYQSYSGAQIFEAIGLNSAFVARYFTGTATQVEGIGLQEVAEEALRTHAQAFGNDPVLANALDAGGEYAFRIRGEEHMWTPDAIAKLQHSTRTNKYDTYKEYARIINDQTKRHMTLRGLFDIKPAGAPVPLSEVEPATEIVKRFATGAMSLGSISTEAHTTLAIAMNRIGGKSNTGEGGEDPIRFNPVTEDTTLDKLIGSSRVEVALPLKKGDSLRSKIKQVASGRFGVTAEYLANADQIQIKMAQGAKPGEGGQLPGHKVSEYIGFLRHSVPGVGLISPPPHHDIYSIEDLAQLIHDLKNSNPHAVDLGQAGVGNRCRHRRRRRVQGQGRPPGDRRP